MKRAVSAAFCTLFLVLGGGRAAFADTAMVLPKNVGRIYVAPTYGFVPGIWDNDGKYESKDDSIQLFNQGVAMEYGILDWLSPAFLWAPGWTPWSVIPKSFNDTPADGNMNGVVDFVVAARIQILGEQGLIRNDVFRFSVSPGITIPFPGPDFEKEMEKMSRGEEAALQNMDKHVFAAAAVLCFDWKINDRFTLNFASEPKLYPVRQDLNKAGPQLAGTKYGIYQTLTAMGQDAMIPALSPLLEDIEGEVNYQFSIKFEVDPGYSLPLSKNITLSMGLPVTYKYEPAPKYSLTGVDTMEAAINTTAPGMGTMLAGAYKMEGSASHNLSVTPGVEIFFTGTPIPLGFKAQYTIPIWGMNSPAQHAFTLQAKMYFALPGAKI